VVGVAVEVMVRVCGGDYGGGVVVEVDSLGMLPLPLVGVLVAAEGLGGGEVPAAVVALKLPAAFPCSTTVGVGGGVSTATLLVIAGCAIVRVAIRGGEVDAKEADAGGGGGGGLGGGAEEGELREGVNVHEIVCLRIFSCCCCCSRDCLFH